MSARRIELLPAFSVGLTCRRRCDPAARGKRILSDDELRKVWHACEDMFGDMIRLLILWGCRNGEIGRLMPQWQERDVMTIPGDSTKNGRAHAIPILPMARAILHRRKTNARYYFPGRLIDDHFKDGS